MVSRRSVARFFDAKADRWLLRDRIGPRLPI